MAMDMKMGAPASKFRPRRNDSIEVMKKIQHGYGRNENADGQSL